MPRRIHSSKPGQWSNMCCRLQFAALEKKGGGQSATPTGPQWALTWGAIALDETTGSVGATVGKYSKNDAKGEAMARCAESGVGDCKLQFAYKNQCAVIAWAAENGNAIGGAASVQSGPSIADASERALASCSSRRGGEECVVVYSDCTKPVQVQ
jgi:hypothetical protein